MNTIIETICLHTTVEDRALVINKQLPKEEYDALKNYLKKLKATWSISKQAHTFPDNTFQNVIQYIIENKTLPVLNPFHLFPTSEVLIDQLMANEKVQEQFNKFEWSTPKFLEPSAGPGAMALKLLAASNGKADIDVYEIDPINQKTLKNQGFQLQGADFLESVPTEKYDLILMNPPFNGKEYIKHVIHARKFLKPSGVLATILPKITSVWGNDVAKAIAQSGGMYWDNPPKSFKDSGTNIDTICAIIEYDEPPCNYEGYPSQSAFSIDMIVNNEASLNKEYDLLMAEISQQQDLLGCPTPEAFQKAKDFWLRAAEQHSSLEGYIDLNDEDIQSLYESGCDRIQEQQLHAS
jgi:16S rRNA G966 N2-methylase RsmD